MEFMHFEKFGLYADFAISDTGNLLLCQMSDKKEPLPDIDFSRFSAVEMHITGVSTHSSNNHGAKHYGSCGSRDLKYVSHTETEDSLTFLLEDASVRVLLHYVFYADSKTVRSWADVTNISHEDVGLEYVTSFCLYGFQMDRLLMPISSCINEMNWREYTPMQLGYTGTDFSSKRINVSNTGTMSTKEYLPMGCVQGAGKTILWQIENNGSWNWEISDVRLPSLYLMLSGPSEQENLWWKNLKPGESFRTVTAATTLVTGDFNDAVGEMTKYRRHIAYRSPADRTLPVIFNDYMRCLWAEPTTEKELPLIDMAADLGAEVYCMDAGWYADGTWWETVGEWKVVEKRFPNGMIEVFDHIREKGMRPGIWLEPESVGINCPILDHFDDSCFFMRHGKRVKARGRYQFDFRSKKVTDFLDGIVDGLIRDYGICYFKFDYNIDAGVGTENDADSFGDGLLQSNRAYLRWIDSLYQRHPDLMIESCASGGMRLDYSTLSHCTIQSLSDSHTYPRLSQIAAMSGTAVLPEQAGVWCLPGVEYSANQTAAGMVSAMFRRIQLSGEVMQVDAEKLQLVREAVAFYKTVRHQIPQLVPFYPLGINQFEDPWICTGFRGEGKTYLCLIRLGDETTVTIPHVDGKNAKILYPQKTDAVLVPNDGGLTVTLAEKAGVVIEL